MRASVRNPFFEYSKKHEGFTPFMYADALNLVTTGIGNLIDNGPRNGFDTSANAMAPALNLPWQHKVAGWSPQNPLTDGVAADPGEITTAWIATKLHEQQNPGFNKKGGFAYQGLTPLSLNLEGVHTLFNKTLDNFNASLAKRYPGYEAAPADAQHALLSMAWAMGPAFNFPAFKAAFDAQDFSKAAELSFFKGGGGTIEKRTGRNADNVIAFNNANQVVRQGADFDRLFFPGSVPANAAPASPLPGIASASSSVLKTAGKAAPTVLGGVAVAGLGYAFYEWWKGRHSYG